MSITAPLKLKDIEKVLPGAAPNKHYLVHIEPNLAVMSWEIGPDSNLVGSNVTLKGLSYLCDRVRGVWR